MNKKLYRVTEDCLFDKLYMKGAVCFVPDRMLQEHPEFFELAEAQSEIEEAPLYLSLNSKKGRPKKKV